MKRIALQKAQREASEKFLNGHLSSLQKYQDDVVARWNAPNDFDKVDIVCTELLRNSSITAALQYMERVRALVDTICAKLLPKAIEEGYEPPETNIRGLNTSRRGPPDATTPIARMSSVIPKTSIAREAADNDVKLARGRLEQANNKIKQLEVQLQDARIRMTVVEKDAAENKMRLDKREADLVQTTARQAKKAAELSSSMARAEASKRVEEAATEENERLKAEVAGLHDKVKKQEKMTAAVRIRLQAAEDLLKREAREEAMAEIRVEMVQEEVMEREQELRTERHKNLKAVKAKNKELELLKAKVRELEKQLEEKDKEAAEMAVGGNARKAKGSKAPAGEPYASKPFQWSYEPAEEASSQKPRARKPSAKAPAVEQQRAGGKPSSAREKDKPPTPSAADSPNAAGTQEDNTS